MNPNLWRSQGAYEELAAAIVYQACFDYAQALKKLKKFHELSLVRELTMREEDSKNSAEKTRTECLEFFNSDWFSLLCSIDPNALITHLNDNAAHIKRPGWANVYVYSGDV